MVKNFTKVSNVSSQLLCHISQKSLPCDSNKPAWLELGLGARRQQKIARIIYAIWRRIELLKGDGIMPYKMVAFIFETRSAREKIKWNGMLLSAFLCSICMKASHPLHLTFSSSYQNKSCYFNLLCSKWHAPEVGQWNVWSLLAAAKSCHITKLRRH